MRCARHPDVETLLTCVACGTPICPDCLVEAPVGMKCPDCSRAPVPAVYRVAPVRLAFSMAVSLVAGAIAGALMLALGGFGLLATLLGIPIGFGISEIASRISGGKRGAMLGLATGISVAVGGIFFGPHLLTSLFGFGVLTPDQLGALLVRRPFYIVAVALAGATAYTRLR